MKRVLQLSVLPLLGVGWITAAVLWSGDGLWLRWRGTPVEGRIAGMLVERPDSADLITGVASVVDLEYSDGRSYRVVAENGVIIQGPDAGVGSPAALDTVVENALRLQAEPIRWALMREARKPAGEVRLVRLLRTDRVEGWFDLPGVPERLGVSGGRVGVEAGPPTVAEIRAEFAPADPSSGRKEMLVSYVFRKNGREVEPHRKDFILACEPYGSQFRPVFAYEAGGRSHASISPIGRHGGATLALRLFNPCRVFVDPKQPERAWLVAVPGAVDGRPLDWFSRYCEGLFSQWGSAALMVLAGLACLATGLLFISLALVPPRLVTG